jgi:hypothetical protein
MGLVVRVHPVVDDALGANLWHQAEDCRVLHVLLLQQLGLVSCIPTPPTRHLSPTFGLALQRCQKFFALYALPLPEPPLGFGFQLEYPEDQLCMTLHLYFLEPRAAAING